MDRLKLLELGGYTVILSKYKFRESLIKEEEKKKE